MNFLNCYTSKWCTFSGRANRAEFWPFFLSLLVMIPILYFINKTLGWQHIPINLTGSYQAGSDIGSAHETIYLGYPLVLFMMYSCIPLLAAKARRLHDRDMSGWMILLALIPIIGAIILIIFYLLPGTEGPNRFDSTQHSSNE